MKINCTNTSHGPSLVLPPSPAHHGSSLDNPPSSVVSPTSTPPLTPTCGDLLNFKTFPLDPSFISASSAVSIPEPPSPSRSSSLLSVPPSPSRQGSFGKGTALESFITSAPAHAKRKWIPHDGAPDVATKRVAVWDDATSTSLSQYSEERHTELPIRNVSTAADTITPQTDSTNTLPEENKLTKLISLDGNKQTDTGTNQNESNTCQSRSLDGNKMDDCVLIKAIGDIADLPDDASIKLMEAYGGSLMDGEDSGSEIESDVESGDEVINGFLADGAGFRPVDQQDFNVTTLYTERKDIPEATTFPSTENTSEEKESTEEREEEFNPYIFIKNLPVKAVGAVQAFPLLPPPLSTDPPFCLVLDLDETLVHCSTEPLAQPDLVFPVTFNSVEYTVFARKRPHIYDFLSRVSALFEVVVFTASQEVYADKLLNILDPEKKFIKHRLFRDSCLCVEGNYLKDLEVLGRDLSKVIIVDNSPQAFGYQIDNGIPIESWFDDDNDTELLSVSTFLENLLTVSDVRPVIREKYKLHELISRA